MRCARIDNAEEGTEDLDGDGLPCDRDDDCDGDDLAGAAEGTGDDDGDGIPNFKDPDSDGDCIADGADAEPTSPGAAVCGDGVVCPDEECDVFSDSACPGRCVPPGSPKECRCALDAMQCYAAAQRGLPRFVRRDVQLVDPFESKRFGVKRPKRLCMPAAEDDDGIADPSTHLACYSIREAKGPHGTRFERRSVTVADQFGEANLTLKSRRRLCVPAVVTNVASTDASLAERLAIVD